MVVVCSRKQLSQIKELNGEAMNDLEAFSLTIR
jgi:hypothetical protein